MDQDSEGLRSAADQLPSSQTSPVAKNQSPTFLSQPLVGVLSTQISQGGSGSKPIHGSSVAYSLANYHAQQIQALSTMLAKQVSPPPTLETKKHIPIPSGSALDTQSHQRVVLERQVTPSYEHEEFNKMAAEEVQGDLSTEVFSAYTARHAVFTSARPHPADIVEAASLADVSLPLPTYDLAPCLLHCDQLSSLQLEGVLYACQRHLTLLPGGKRAGFFIGDGAGVGKGRQIAAIIVDNYIRGRCRHIWFSVSHDLKMDAERDLRDIGCYIKVIDGCQQLDKETRILGLPADFKEGVLFSTYATLVSTVHRGGQSHSRLQQLVSWCGGEAFDGCLVFDECHKAKNFIPGKEQRSTKVALAVSMVQKMLPQARVVYCSATGVSDVKNMAYMERLGLWGEGLAFRNFDSFLESITRRGLGAAEMLAMEMKSAGVYVSRGLSYKQAEFSTREVELSPTQVSIYDSACHVWSELRKSLVIALSRVGAPNQRVWSTFWSAHQRFFKQLCMSMKVPAIVEEVKRALSHDMAVVIGLQTTGESSLESEREQCNGKILGFVSLCKEILQRFVQEHFPTAVSRNPANEPVQVQDLWCVAAKDMLLEFIAKMQLPNNPLDELLDQLGGPDCVAEMTGRKGRVVRERGKGDLVHYQLRDSGGNSLESLNNTERAAFMDGEKVVAIISDAASTGISLHSDLSARNHRRRLHITMELPWSADKAVQQLGRSHRANQASGPVYMLITTNVGGERRFAAAVAKRLQTLGALTKGDRRAATGVEFSEFNYDTHYGRSALRHLYNSLQTKQIVSGVNVQNVCTMCGVDRIMTAEELITSLQSCLDVMGVEENGVVKEGDMRDVSKFLNRLLGLKLLKQNMMFAYFCECLSVVISIAKKEGRFNEGVTDIKAESIQMIDDPKEVFTDYKLSHIPTMHTHVVVDRGIGWERALELYHQHASDHDLLITTDSGSGGQVVTTGSGFYRSKREQYHRYLYLLALRKEASTHLFNIVRPNTGRSFFEETKADLLNKYVPVSLDSAEKGWKSQYEMTKKHCIHGSSCKNKQSCLIGSRLTHVHLLSGGILPLLSLLESTLTRHAHTMALSKEARSLRVVRVQLDDGRRVIGVRYPLPLISEIATMLSVLKHSQQVDHGNTLPIVIPTAAKDVVIEVQTPINKKALTKALTPPVSIKNFFQVKPKSEIDAKPDAASSTDSLPSDDKRKKGNTSGKMKPVQAKLLDSFTAITPATSRDCPIVIEDGESEGQCSSNEHSSGQRKRRLPCGTNSLVKMFKRSESLSAMTCPVCGLKIEAISNSAINLHIDKCLASSAAQT